MTDYREMARIELNHRKSRHMNTVNENSEAFIKARQAHLVKALKPHLPEHALLWEPEDTIPYECDGLAAYRRMPLAVALPENEAQVSRILQICHAMNVPVVPRGAGTGHQPGGQPVLGRPRRITWRCPRPSSPCRSRHPSRP